VIENYKRFGPVAVLSIHIADNTALKAEDLLVRRIDYDFDLIRLAAA